MSESVHLSEPQSRTLAYTFRRIEWFEAMGHGFSVHSFARICDRELDKIAGKSIFMDIRPVAGGNRYSAPLWHGIARVDAQIQYGNPHLTFIAANSPSLGSKS